ncbi:MAG: hypothetical protein M1608_01090, partial [Candidatus Omnitrophica bacterium]|nr:hypothetical protein [Candidatus Omnitrophota bacterium]
MPSELDPNIEQWLEAYAKRRREAAGAPLEMPSAMRQFLQTEIARAFSERDEAGVSWARRLTGWWPRLAWGSALVAVLAVVIWAFRPSPARHEERLRLVRNDTQEVRQIAKALPPVPPAVLAPPPPSSTPSPLMAESDKEQVSAPAAAPLTATAAAPVAVGRLEGKGLTASSNARGLPAPTQQFYFGAPKQDTFAFARRSAAPLTNVLGTAAGAAPVQKRSVGERSSNAIIELRFANNLEEPGVPQVKLRAGSGAVETNVLSLQVLNSFTLDRQGEQ